ncbi:MAG: tetratricopeptide repeat protein [Elainellaceae cyanobacterium]
MNDSTLPVIYLGVLVVLLSVTGLLLFRQVLKTRRVERTFTRLQNKLSKEKGSSREYYELGGIYLEKRLYSQAINLFQKALKSKDLQGAENIAVICNALGFAYASQEQYDLAIRYYKDALDQTPEYVTALKNLGFAYEKKQLTAQAIEVYDKVLDFEPNDSVAKKRSASLRKRLSDKT